MTGIVEDIFIASEGGREMERVAEAEAVAHAGLRGDRYARHVGYWSGVDECEVTLIEAEGLDEISTTTDLSVRNGEHRRNIVTRGVRLHELEGKQFSVGEAVLEYDQPRPPCSYIQSLTQQAGLTKALGKGRAGICVRVIKAGLIRRGDAIAPL